MLSLLYLVVHSVLRLIDWSQRSRNAQALEVMVLRHQLEVLNRQVGRARFETHDRLLLAGRRPAALPLPVGGLRSESRDPAIGTAASSPAERRGGGAGVAADPRSRRTSRI